MTLELLEKNTGSLIVIQNSMIKDLCAGVSKLEAERVANSPYSSDFGRSIEPISTGRGRLLPSPPDF
jgi:hypothetical protein